MKKTLFSGPTPALRAGPRFGRGPRMAPGSVPARMLVLGFGNTLRGDDAAGPLAVEAVAALNLSGVTVETRHQLTPELAELVAGFNQVVFVDAEPAPDVDDQQPARMREIVPVEAGPARLSVFGHHQDPGTLLGLARCLYGATPRAWLVTIIACSFELGAKPSLPCAQGIARAVDLVEDLAEKLAAQSSLPAARSPASTG